ncbi:hypothetical protein BH23THE1_BH23THE1_26750 [soil metagenome]
MVCGKNYWHVFVKTPCFPFGSISIGDKVKIADNIHLGPRDGPKKDSIDWQDKDPEKNFKIEKMGKVLE